MSTPMPENGVGKVKPVWPYVVLAVMSIPAAIATAVVGPMLMLQLGIGDSYFEGTDWLIWGVIVLGVLLAFAVPGTIGAIKTSQANAAARTGQSHQTVTPIGSTPDGLPIYAQSGAAGTNGLAIATIITAFIFPIAAIILGHIARAQVRRTGQEGAGLALAGLIIAYIQVVLGLIVIAVFAIMAVNQGTI